MSFIDTIKKAWSKKLKVKKPVYAFYCKSCGYFTAAMTKDEAKVKKAQHYRKIPIVEAGGVVKGYVKRCPYVRTAHGTLVRPDLKKTAELNHKEKGNS